ncbi:dnaJ homolog subfamily C member 10 isoform X1 [Syngnathus acus]|uniref:dnaJ homolog subfamily C member 10 isoform X1 n=2 Tax=Syngnathus acus TaxID=161584 RepID=UPI0018864546|nr:dnaJ homolog subfamily C member 10 isoform X1 [Syngnathus acus]
MKKLAPIAAKMPAPHNGGVTTPMRRNCSCSETRAPRPAAAALLALLLLGPALPPAWTDAAGRDYYELLGVGRDANTRQIRQAFKKLALTMHPDKNPGDAEAHDKFLQINRAYEVLKDDDLREKYDKYGEKGLERPQGGRYESWNFYRYDFGIYDDDLEIITLDTGDFEAAVNSGEIWFINFYSPRCSHCHQLAPTWREFAKEMEGAIRIGAVNCGDEHGLCRRQGIGSYPSLYIFTAGHKAEKFHGERLKDNLVTFSMRFIKTSDVQLQQGNVFGEMESAFAAGLSWLVTFCADTGDCLERETRQKLAAMLDGLVRVGWMDCGAQPQLCQSFQVTGGATALFLPGSALDTEGGVLWLDTLDSREIYTRVLRRLPDLQLLTADSFHFKLARHRWLIAFTFGERGRDADEYKKLRAFLRDDHIQVGRVDCIADPQLCRSLHIHKACVAVFKGLGVHDFEIHHGKDAVYNVVAFARDSVRAHVTTLRPDNFPSGGSQPWLVDFFAPWCPPCRTLLPELRKASIRLAGRLKFGTLDCTVHRDLCSAHNIGAYPTTVIFNGSAVHRYEGRHSADGILEFVQDLVDPSVVVLDPSGFAEKVTGLGQGEIWAIDFSAPWCGPCQALLPEWRRMARMVSGHILVGSVDCQRFQSFCQSQNVRSYPELRLYTGGGRTAYRHTSYSGYHRDAHTLRRWALSALPRASSDLTPSSFDALLLEARDPWVVDFYAPWCGPCKHFSPEFEVLARVLKGEVRAAKIDCQAHYQTCQSAGIAAYPTVRFYPSQDTDRVSTRTHAPAARWREHQQPRRHGNSRHHQTETASLVVTLAQQQKGRTLTDGIGSDRASERAC